MTVHHRNAPLTVEGRRRLAERCQTRPIAHVAAEMGISRATASKWVNRYRQFGEFGLMDRSSTSLRHPTAMDPMLIARIERMRRKQKWSAARIEFELESDGVAISRRTVSRILLQLGLNRRRFIDPNGESNREPQRIVAERPGHSAGSSTNASGNAGGDLPRTGAEGVSAMVGWAALLIAGGAAAVWATRRYRASTGKH